MSDIQFEVQICTFSLESTAKPANSILPMQDEFIFGFGKPFYAEEIEIIQRTLRSIHPKVKDYDKLPLFVKMRMAYTEDKLLLSKHKSRQLYETLLKGGSDKSAYADLWWSIDKGVEASVFLTHSVATSDAKELSLLSKHEIELPNELTLLHLHPHTLRQI